MGSEPQTLLVVRHAQADRRVDDGPLTAVGRRQAAALAEALPPVETVSVFSSPYVRARETAAYYTENAAVVAGLAEFDFGPEWDQVEGMEQRSDLQFWRPDDGPPGGDTLRGFQQRVHRALERAIDGSEPPGTVLFTHAGVVDAILRWAYGLGPGADWATEVEAPNASITELLYWPDGRGREGAPRFVVVHRIGDVEHLTSADRSPI